MNLRIDSLLVFLSFLPLWVVKFNIYNDNFFIILTFYFLSCLFLILLLNFSNLKFKKIYILLLTSIVTFGLDNHLSLNRELTSDGSILAEKFGGMYFASIIVLMIVFFFNSNFFFLL